MKVNEKTLRLESTAMAASNVYIQVLWITMFAALTAMGARVEIWQYPVPFTLQTMFVLLSGAFLGRKNGALSQILYLGVGAIGLPVFAAGGLLGVARFLGPTGGYLLAFPAAAFLTGYMLEKGRSYLWILFSMAAGLTVIYTAGAIHLYFTLLRDVGETVRAGIFVFGIWEPVKLLAAAGIYHRLSRRNR